MRRSKAVSISDFSGGLNTKDSVTSLSINESYDIDNIVLLPKSGFVKRNGNTKLNTSAMDSGASIHGLGYYRQIGGSDWLLSITGSKIYNSSGLSSTMNDITGSVNITTGDNNIWTYVQMNDLAIFVGGDRASDVQ